MFVASTLLIGALAIMADIESQESEAKAKVPPLELTANFPDEDMIPENVLFICNLHSVTTADDLEIVFSRFGKVKSCEVIGDVITGDSLQYAFIEFQHRKSCEDARLKMDNVLFDERRIHVDFAQSVTKVKWRGKGRGVVLSDATTNLDRCHNLGDEKDF